MTHGEDPTEGAVGFALAVDDQTHSSIGSIEASRFSDAGITGLGTPPLIIETSDTVNAKSPYSSKYR